jgi:metal-responsive CopG/Arc/MetJ family transcriptional regulator
MAKSISVLPKKRGRPATGRDPVTAIRLSPALRSKLDEWCKEQNDQPSRSEAIRRLVEQALSSKGRARKPPGEKAADLAAQAIEKRTDKSQSAEEQKSRKRKLISGPSEFRDIRRDQPKRKT